MKFKTHWLDPFKGASPQLYMLYVEYNLMFMVYPFIHFLIFYVYGSVSLMLQSVKCEVHDSQFQTIFFISLKSHILIDQGNEFMGLSKSSNNGLLEKKILTYSAEDFLPLASWGPFSPYGITNNAPPEMLDILSQGIYSKRHLGIFWLGNFTISSGENCRQWLISFIYM